MTGHSDDPLEQLRAADPAAGHPAPDHERIRATVDARLTHSRPGTAGSAVGQLEIEPLEDGASGPAAPSSAATDKLAADRRRRQPLRYVAAAAGIVLFLGTGYALGLATDRPTGGQNVADAGAPEPANQDASGASEIAPDSGQQADPDRASSDGAAGDLPGQTSAAERAWPRPQRTEFTAGDLGPGSQQGHVWGLDGAVDGDLAARLARSVGLSGEPHEQDGTWVVDADASGEPVLHLYSDGSIDYSDPELQSVLCLPLEPMTEPDSGAAAEESEAEPGGSASSGASGSLDCTRADVPAPPDAEATFATFLTDAGLDGQDYALDVSTAGGSATVTGTLVLAGQPTDVTISAAVVADGIASLWGSVATAYDLGAYPLVSPDVAVQRLADPRFGAGLSGVAAVPDPRSTGSADGDAPTSSPASAPAELLAPGSPIPWPVRHVQITTAELTLVTTPTSAGVLLVPAYALTGTDSGGTQSTWTVPAPTEAVLDFGN